MKGRLDGFRRRRQALDERFGVKTAQIITVPLLMLAWGLAPGPAEPQPNLSGTWALDKTRSVVQAGDGSTDQMLARSDLVLVIDHQGTTLKVERRVKIMSLERSNTSVYYTDGREVSNPNMRGKPIISRANWERDALVIENRATVGSNGKKLLREWKEVFHLSALGKLLTRKKEDEETLERVTFVFVRK